jgi:hypothetical protein
MVVHIYNPSYLRDQGRKILSSRSDRTRLSQKQNSSGGIAQDVECFPILCESWIQSLVSKPTNQPNKQKQPLEF